MRAHRRSPCPVGMTCRSSSLRIKAPASINSTPSYRHHRVLQRLQYETTLSIIVATQVPVASVRHRGRPGDFPRSLCRRRQRDFEFGLLYGAGSGVRRNRHFTVGPQIPGSPSGQVRLHAAPGQRHRPRRKGHHRQQSHLRHQNRQTHRL